MFSVEGWVAPLCQRIGLTTFIELTLVLLVHEYSKKEIET